MRRHDRGPFPPIPHVTHIPSVEEAKREQKAASERFIEAAHNGPEVRRVSAEMKRLRIRNGFEDLIEAGMERRKDPR